MRQDQVGEESTWREGPGIDPPRVSDGEKIRGMQPGELRRSREQTGRVRDPEVPGGAASGQSPQLLSAEAAYLRKPGTETRSHDLAVGRRSPEALKGGDAGPVGVGSREDKKGGNGGSEWESSPPVRRGSG